MDERGQRRGRSGGRSWTKGGGMKTKQKVDRTKGGDKEVKNRRGGGREESLQKVEELISCVIC